MHQTCDKGQEFLHYETETMNHTHPYWWRSLMADRQCFLSGLPVWPRPGWWWRPLPPPTPDWPPGSDPGSTSLPRSRCEPSTTDTLFSLSYSWIFFQKSPLNLASNNVLNYSASSVVLSKLISKLTTRYMAQLKMHKKL